MNSMVITLLPAVEQVLKYDDLPGSAQVLREILAQAQGSLPEKFETQIIALKFERFPSLSENECEVLVREHLVFGFRLPFIDILDKISVRIKFAENDTDQIHICELFEAALQKNAEILGNNRLKIGGKEYNPTLHNWLLDYDSISSRGKMRGSFEQVEYFSRSSNILHLDEKDKEILQKIIRLYDMLLNFLHEYRYGKEITDEKEVFADFDLYRTLPGLAFEGEEEYKKGKADSAGNQKRENFDLTQSSGQKNITSQNINLKTQPNASPQEPIFKKENKISEIKLTANLLPTLPKAPLVNIDKKLEQLKQKVKK